jgi:DNA-directed RNA polymerase subunit M/transcription elongation factor TFIIS
MHSLLDNAIQSLQLGIEDYQANDPKRALSAVRNFYAGVLLLAKEVLVRAAPKADPDEILGAQYKPVPDGKGGIDYSAVGHRTIDFNDIGKRFSDFGLSIDRAALNELNRIRNEIEHLYTSSPRESVREAIARAFPVVVDLLRLAEEEPHVLGDAWPIMLEVRDLYQRELAACQKTFENIEWRSTSMSEAALLCPKCGSHLIAQYDSSNTNLGLVVGQCRACGESTEAEDLIEASLEAYFEVESHVAAKDGGEPPLGVCPECGRNTYIGWQDENACVLCQATLGKCWRCSSDLTPENVSADNSSMCAYCDHVMSKDD